ncbi:hypothetical protein PoB_006805500 [Plakobranchus ocellatus]|uniref:Uncharacterized protein n=1 Tax=Plakobranchus ocellatus TaxID=259542 RepID=A0AAV4DC76_9GAST|nr:hypothetical protein PoB_006805500 [Plakobranchus ocellatus]
MAKGWASQMLNESIQGKNRGIVCTAANTLCTFPRRPLVAGARLSPCTHLPKRAGSISPKEKTNASQPARLVQIQATLDDPKISH